MAAKMIADFYCAGANIDMGGEFGDVCEPYDDAAILDRVCEIWGSECPDECFDDLGFDDSQGDYQFVLVEKYTGAKMDLAVAGHVWRVYQLVRDGKPVDFFCLLCLWLGYRGTYDYRAARPGTVISPDAIDAVCKALIPTAEGE